MSRPYSTMVMLVVIMLASFKLQPTVAKTRHIVGDAMGWTIPLLNGASTSTYATWASKRTFTVGDTLLFNFTTGFHTVAEVSQSANPDPCSSNDTLSLYSTSPATITLTRPGTHYYICTIIGHCQLGQKLTINVSHFAATAPESTLTATPIGSPISLPWSASPPAFNKVVHITHVLVIALAFFY